MEKQKEILRERRRRGGGGDKTDLKGNGGKRGKNEVIL